MAEVKPINVDNVKDLMKRLKKMDMTEGTEETKNLTVDEIVDKIKEIKAVEAKRKEDLKPKKYIPPGGWPEHPTSLRITSTAPLHAKIPYKNPHNISQFKTKPVVWDASFGLSKELKAAVHRLPWSDPSGRRIFSLSREEPKGVKTWYGRQPTDRDLPQPSCDLLTDSFCSQLRQHVQWQADTVAKSIEKMPETTGSLRNIKAKMSADLANLEHKRDAILTMTAKRFENTAPGTNTINTLGSSHGKSKH